MEPYGEESAHDVEYRPDHTMLLGATLAMVLGAYVVCQVPWPWLWKPHSAKAHRSASSDPPMQRPHSPQCSQLSPRKTPTRMQSAHTLQSGFQTAVSTQHDRPFRFSASEADNVANDCATPEQQEWQQQLDKQHTEAGELERARQELQQQLSQQQFSTPPPARQQSHLHQEEEDEGNKGLQELYDQELEQQQLPASSWDPELLAKCAITLPYISSVDALQRSPAFRVHIKRVRGQRLHYETTESRKLHVYKALWDVDPASCVQLFSRKDVREYDEEVPSRLLTAFECLVTAALNLTLLAVPWVAPGLGSYRLLGAATWMLLTLTSASCGCTSPVACLLQMHATQGEYNMLPSFYGLAAAAMLEAGLVVSTAGMGALVSLVCRLVGKQRQSFGDRLLKFVPLREVVRPMRFCQIPHMAGLRALHLGD